MLGNWLVDSCLLHMLVACFWFGVRCVVGVVGVWVMVWSIVGCGLVEWFVCWFCIDWAIVGVIVVWLNGRLIVSVSFILP